jgi:hypothetical protein
MLELEEPERSSALSIRMVMRLKRLGRGSVLVVAVFSSVGREVKDLVGPERVGFVTAAVFADGVASPAVACARGTGRRFGADMVLCDGVCGPVLALRSGVDEDDGPAGASRLERSVLVDCMLEVCVVCRCQNEEVRMLVGGLCSRAGRRALSPARAKTCEWMPGGELQARESSHKAAFMCAIAARSKVKRGELSSGCSCNTALCHTLEASLAGLLCT